MRVDLVDVQDERRPGRRTDDGARQVRFPRQEEQDGRSSRPRRRTGGRPRPGTRSEAGHRRRRNAGPRESAARPEGGVPRARGPIRSGGSAGPTGRTARRTPSRSAPAFGVRTAKGGGTTGLACSPDRETVRPVQSPRKPVSRRRLDGTERPESDTAQEAAARGPLGLPATMTGRTADGVNARSGDRPCLSSSWVPRSPEPQPSATGAKGGLTLFSHARGPGTRGGGQGAGCSVRRREYAAQRPSRRVTVMSRP